MVLKFSFAYRPELGKNLNADEAVALGAVYQGAGHSKMFRVKKFLVKEGTVFPIQVQGHVVTTITKFTLGYWYRSSMLRDYYAVNSDRPVFVYTHALHVHVLN